MKFLIIVILITWSCLIASGQNYLSMGYNATASGRNISIDFSRIFKDKNEAGIGLRVNISKIAQADDQSNIYYKRLFATEFIHYFGIQAYYRRYFFMNWNCARPYLFYDFQMTKSTTRSSMFIPYAYDTNGDVLYKNYIEYFGPFLWIEQSIGVGCRERLSGSFFLFQNLGATIQFLIGKEEQLLRANPNFEWEFGYLFSFGVTYQLGK